jgi:hypothetical protein
VRQDETDVFYFVNILRVLRMTVEYEKEPAAETRAVFDHIEKYLTEEMSRLSGPERERVEWFKKYFDWATVRSAGEPKPATPSDL